MSVANVILEPHRARLVGDTVGYREKQPVILESKVHIVELAHIAFTVRGLSAIGHFLDRHSDDWRDFESAVASATSMLEMLSKDALPGGTAEVTILGWNKGRVAVARLGASWTEEGTKVRRIDLEPGVYLAPSLGAHQIPASLTDEQILKVALLQQSISIKHGLNICVGGDVEVTTITAEGIETRKIGEYPDKRLTEVRIAKAEQSDIERAAA